MPINFKNYRTTTSVDTSGSEIIMGEKTLLTGVQNGTVVKTLEIISGNESSILYVTRKDTANTTYATIKVDLKANDYLILWEGFFLIPFGHKLCVSADSNYVSVVSNVVEMT